MPNPLPLTELKECQEIAAEAVRMADSLTRLDADVANMNNKEIAADRRPQVRYHIHVYGLGQNERASIVLGEGVPEYETLQRITHNIIVQKLERARDFLTERNVEVPAEVLAALSGDAGV